MGHTRNLFGNEKTRSVVTFWIPILFLLSFFLINQLSQWSHFMRGETKPCSACPYAATGLEILWMYFQLIGAFITSDLSEKFKKLYGRYLMVALWALPSLTGAKIALRFSSPNGLGFWYVGLLLEITWLYVSIANLLIWIALNWKVESAKVQRGLSTAQWHCAVYYITPVSLMVYGVIQYRVMECLNSSEGSLLLASSFAELAFVLGPIKSALSWHLRP